MPSDVSNNQPEAGSTRAPGSLVDATVEGAIEVTVWELEMTDRADLNPRPKPQADVDLMVAVRPAPALSKMFYGLVGANHYWVDRRSWTDVQWQEWVDRSEHHLVSAWVEGAPAGYFELVQVDPLLVELAYFGLAPEFIGRGIGGWLLTVAIERAWAIPNTTRLRLFTCSLDGPHAVPNYQSRGFRVIGQRTEWRLAEAT